MRLYLSTNSLCYSFVILVVCELLCGLLHITGSNTVIFCCFKGVTYVAVTLCCKPRSFFTLIYISILSEVMLKIVVFIFLFFVDTLGEVKFR